MSVPALGHKRTSIWKLPLVLTVVGIGLLLAAVQV
ncbi:MAG: hypothetical protein JWM85_1323, partial [Acidimicrobiaceae bacterium]|nr:hypothetical protein [Acidimicrobiaceae bacterium]